MLVAGCLSLLVWLVLLFARGGYWRAGQRDDGPVAGPGLWPSVVAVVPARDEAAGVARAIASLVAQDYPGAFRIVLVDDGSSDGTADLARAAAGMSDRLEVLRGRPLAAGWTGKLWAVSQGVARAGGADYLLLTDADIEHVPGNVRSLVARAAGGGLVLTSLMARLQCTTLPERLLVPAFVYFFQMLFPFSYVNRPGPVAAAAGGVMLIERAALERAGGIAAVRGAIIDDCAMAALMKAHGPIRLLLTDRALSLRPYRSVGEIGAMIARSAYAQLRYSPLLLAGTLFGLAVVFVAPPVATLCGSGAARIAGAAGWLLMALSFQPMLRFYRRSPLWGVALPLIAMVYAWYTLVSAVQVWRGAGGQWKGRAQALVQP
ncbi:MAG: glycosyltransferase [Janthinobacterium lividum]